MVSQKKKRSQKKGRGRPGAAGEGRKKQLTGELVVARGGFGFVIIEGRDEDVFVPQHRLGGAVAGDTVRLEVTRGRRGKGLEGTITDVIRRGRTHLVGTLEKVPGGFELATLEPLGGRAIRLATGAVRDGREGDLAYVEITDWGGKESAIKGRVDEIIGRADDPRTDFTLVLRQHDLQENFPKDVEEEVAASAKKVDIGPGRHREDLRHLMVVTIDPVSAKDFDDAISLEKLEHGRWSLGVHIADVSAYVLPGSKTDTEAFNRCNSVYFNEGVVPMLPHLLSSDLCSLRPNVDRPAMSAIMTLTSNGEVQKVRFTRSVIHSKQRFSYEDVHEILAAGRGTEHRMLADLKQLTTAIQARRQQQGSIDFDIPEPLFELDKFGVPHHIHPSQRLDSHRMVEECMLLANRLVAEKIPHGKPRSPFLYRVHDEPGKEKMAELSTLLARLKLPGLPRGEVTSAMVRDLLLAMEESPYEDLIENLTLRSMAKAAYSSRNVGHFGLAFEMYTHFTSPIRRYADLVVHRMMAQKFTGGGQMTKAKALDKIAARCTTREIASQKAERAYRRLKELRYLATQVGKRFPGIISGVTNKGLFVQISEILVDGFVPLERMEDDAYYYDDSLYALIGRKHRRQWQMGQEVTIRVHDVSVEGRRADFVLLDRP
ncbi:MAG: ribonuclease R [Candidatus Marinimicrobia bacterium]|nr:ribonuclease R [Candidatus Neomarinimicrobiota bacterium]